MNRNEILYSSTVTVNGAIYGLLVVSEPGMDVITKIKEAVRVAFGKEPESMTRPRSTGWDALRRTGYIQVIGYLDADGFTSAWTRRIE
jgi:hypothetical protein